MRSYIKAMLVCTMFIFGTAIAEEKNSAPDGGGERSVRHPRPMQPGGEMMKHRDRVVSEERGGGRDCMIERLLENPKLTEEIGISKEKVDEIKAKIAEISKKQVELEAKQKLAAIEQAELMRAEKVDEAAIMTAVDKSGAIHTEIAKSRIAKMILLKKAMTPEQIKKARSAFEKSAGERRESWKNRPDTEDSQNSFRDRLKQRKADGDRPRIRKNKDGSTESEKADKKDAEPAGTSPSPSA